MMRNYLKFIAHLIAALWVSLAVSGSYEDFFVAIKQDDPAAIRALLQRGFDPNTPNPEGLPALYVALRDGSLKAANVLIDARGTKIDARTDKDETPLMMASLHGHLDIVRKLIAKDADVVKPGWAPLHYAATNGHVAVMELLLEHHAFIDAESPNGTTPLMMAAMYGTPEAVRFLLEAGADPSMKNQLGLSAADFAARAGRKDLAQTLAVAARAFEAKYKKRQGSGRDSSRAPSANSGPGGPSLDAILTSYDAYYVK